MKQVDYENIELSIYEKFVLHSMSIFRLDKLYLSKTVRRLFELGFIERYKYTKHGTLYRRTANGKMYFRIKRKIFLRFAIPTIISIIALLAAYDVLWIKPVDEALRAIASLLKNIVESLDTFRKMVF